MMDLSSVCRLCGTSNIIRDNHTPCPKERFAKCLQRAYKLSVENDVPSVHPKFICEACKRKLERWWSKGQYKGQVPNITLAEFQLPKDLQDDDKSEREFWDIVKESGKQCGFIVMDQQDSGVLLMVIDDDGFPRKTLRIKHDKSASATILSHPFDIQSIFSSDALDNRNVLELLQTFAKINPCPGISGFGDLCLSLAPHGRAAILNSEGKIEAMEDMKCSVRTNVIRHVSCELTNNCQVCIHYRANLYSKRTYLCKKENVSKDPLSSHARNDRLSHEELEWKLKLSTAERRHLKRKVCCLEDKVDEMLMKESVIISEKMNKSLQQVMDDNGGSVENSFEQGSMMHLLWQQQLKAAKKPAKQMRWHPALIRWCIALHAKSPAAYKMIGRSKILRLPHESTLRDYTHFTTGKSGFNFSVLERIVHDHLPPDVPDFKRNVALAYDEMKVKAGLVYSAETGELIGFCDLGDVNSELAQLAKQCLEEHDEPKVATHVIAFMIRGLFSHLEETFAFFPCVGFTSHQLYNVVWEAVGHLEFHGFLVRAFISDGASPNRRFYRLHAAADPENVTYYTVNLFDPEEKRKIYFICDPPHLMKTVRNNWENSGYHNKTRNLWYNGQPIKWTQLMNLVESGGRFKLVNKVTYDHLHLTPSLRMKVKLATQVLSTSVADAFAIENRPDTQSVQKFVRMMDMFFDCLNVSNKKTGLKKRKPAAEVYRDPEDWRFKWLEEDFLEGFINDWDAKAQAVPDLTKNEKNRLCLSRETLEGIRITVKAFVALVKELLSLPGVEFFLSEKLSQDPLEEYFSKQRGIGGRSENPTVLQFQNNALAIQVARSPAVLSSTRGNFEHHDGTMELDDTPMQKRPRRK